MALSLYEYPDAYRELWTRIENQEPNLGEPAAVGRDEFEALEGEYSDKVENIAKLVRSLEATHDALDAESKRLKQRATVVKRKIEWLRNYVVESMVALGPRKIEGEVLNVTLANNHRVEMDGAQTVPERFRTTVQDEKIDVAGIRQALKDGEDVPGARLIETHSIRIK